MRAPETVEPMQFGIEREFEYGGHITPAVHLEPLPRRTFVSADESHIRVWGPQGDIAKTAFPLNRRSMVAALTYCQTFSVVLTAEVDMTIKAYSADKLEMLEAFSLEQAREKQGEKGGRSSSKVCAMSCMPQNSQLLLGGERGCELWQVLKSARRRQALAGRLEFHLNIEFVRQVCDREVSQINISASEQRVILWGPKWLGVYDMNLKELARCATPHGGELTRCACVHVVSFIHTALLTGGTDGNVNYWSIQAKPQLRQRPELRNFTQSDAAGTDPSAAGTTVRLDHSFQGHLRAVEMVCYYHRLEKNQRQRLAVSLARDCRLKVWSLEAFTNVYTLDFPMLDARASIFPLAPHLLAVSTSQSTGDGSSQRAAVSVMRFSAYIAAPFATTNHSPVIQIAQPPCLPDLGPSIESVRNVPLRASNCAVLVSEDMAVRVIDGQERRMLSTLPPPPNSTVQVLTVLICPMWQLLLLWLSSQEIAIFFMPSVRAARSSSESVKGGEEPEGQTGREITTPLLIRRFSIVEVRAATLDRDLSKEAFSNVALYHGIPLPISDQLAYGGFEPKPREDAEDEEEDLENDWFLVVGTKLGTVQAFRLGQILKDTPIWEKLHGHLPQGYWKKSRYTRGEESFEEEDLSDPKMAKLHQEHLEALELARAPGQRPFPKLAPPVRIHVRWKGHHYPIVDLVSSNGRLLTVDNKRILKIWTTKDLKCIFYYKLNSYRCYSPFLRPELLPSVRPHFRPRHSSRFETNAEQSSSLSSDSSTLDWADGRIEGLVLSGLVLGSSGGSLSLVSIANRTSKRSNAAAGRQPLRPKPSQLQLEDGDQDEEGEGEGVPDREKEEEEEDEEEGEGQEEKDEGATKRKQEDGDADEAWRNRLRGRAEQEEAEVLQSESTHADAVLAVDFLYPLNAFVSAGRDDVVKLWNRRLSLLREIVFPQALTYVAFKRDSEMNRQRGHGDILVGFAAHVEQLSWSCWSRGLEQYLGCDLDGGGSKSKDSDYQDGDDWPDNIESIDDLHHLLPEEQYDGVPGHPVPTEGLAKRVEIADVTYESSLPEELAAEILASDLAKLRLRNGHVQDFRGPPAVALAELNNRYSAQAPPAEQVAEAPPNFDTEFERTQLLDPGDFRAITRADAGYYDWSVTPNVAVDAPREKAIRGVSNVGNNVAVVTSVGIGHLRGADEFNSKSRDSQNAASRGTAKDAEAVSPRSPRGAAEGSSPQVANIKSKKRAATRPAPRPNSRDAKKVITTSSPQVLQMQTQLAVPSDRPPSATRQVGALPQLQAPEKTEKTGAKQHISRLCTGLTNGGKGGERVRRASIRSNRSNISNKSNEGQAPPGSAATDLQTGDERYSSSASAAMTAVPSSVLAEALAAEEAWRARRVGRGVPIAENTPRPKLQAEAHKPENPVRILQGRGYLEQERLVEDDDGDILHKLANIKSQWLFYPPENAELLAAVRQHEEEEARLQQQQQHHSFSLRRPSNASAGFGPTYESDGMAGEAASNLKSGALGLNNSSRQQTFWTTTGRLVCKDSIPPSGASLSLFASKQPYPGLTLRQPMTRAEFTEQRLIEAALRPPKPPNPDSTALQAATMPLAPRPSSRGPQYPRRPHPLSAR